MTENYQQQLPVTTGTFYRSGWLRVSRKNPCPICGKPDNCTVSEEGGAVWCGRVSDGSVHGPNGGGQWLHKLETWKPAEWTHPSHYAKAKPPEPLPADFTALHARLMKAPERPAKLRELASSLGVSVESLELLEVAWDGQAWTFPEHNSEGRLIGISRRFPNGFKCMTTGHDVDQPGRKGRRGLSIPAGWDRGGPVLLIEGGSDTAALVTMELTAIGRPSNLGGVLHLADLIEAADDIDDDRPLIVVAEDDRLKDGKPRKLPADHSADCDGCGSCWPGLSGAKTTAQQLADELRRPVAWSLPPDGAKDAREWLNDQTIDEDAVDLGQRFQSHLLAGLTVVEPSPQLPVVVAPKDRRPVEKLELIRELMKAKRIESIGKPGVNLCRGGTGLGKTYQDIEAAVEAANQGQQALFLMPTHSNCGEVVRTFEDRGVEAVAYPRRDTGGLAPNCWNPAADQAESLGLPVVRSVCQGCSFKDQCERSGYLAGIMKASEADVRVATHARGSFQSLEDLAAGAEFISIQEDAVDLLAPSADLSRDHLIEVAGLLDRLLNDPRELKLIDDADNGDDQDAFLRHLADVTDDLIVKLDSAETTTELPAIDRRDIPTGIERRLFRNAREQKKYAPAWRVLLGIASGNAKAFAVVNLVHQKGNQQKQVIVKSLLAVWSNPVPANATVWIGDGTADPETIKRLLPAGVKFRDQTPGVKAPVIHKAVQIPEDITREKSPRIWANVLRGVLANRPDAKKIGIIHHSTHKAAAAAFKAEDPRIGRTTHFGSGLDRSSNVWIEEGHDLIVELGTPRPGPAGARRYLLVIGETEAAAELDPQWVKFRWIGETESGEEVAVESRRYADPIWQRAFESICRAGLIQTIGRGRGICADGAEVIAVSTEECGIPVSDLAVVQMNATESEALAAVKRLSGESTENANRDPLGKAVDSRLVRTGAIMKAIGKARSTTQDALKSLESRGLVIHHSKAGWRPVVPSEASDSGLEIVPPPAETSSEASEWTAQQPIPADSGCPTKSDNKKGRSGCSTGPPGMIGET